MASNREIAIIIKAVDKASAELRTATKALKELGGGAKEADEKTKTLFEKFKALKGEILGAAGVLVGFGVALKKAFDLGEAGAVVTQTTESFEMLMGSLGAAPNILAQMKDAVGGTVDEMSLMSSTMTLVAGASNELASSMVDAAPRLLEIAKAANKLNPSLGSTTFLYESLARGIKRSSPLILDNTGLVIKVGEANQAYADALGVTVEALTATDKQQALLNAALKAGDVLIQQVGGDTDSATDSFQRLRVALKEMADAYKEDLAPAVAQTADAFTTLLLWDSRLQDGLVKQAGVVQETAGSYEEYSAEIERMAKLIGVIITSSGDMYTKQGELVESGAVLTETQWNMNAAIERGFVLTDAAAVSISGYASATAPAVAALAEFNSEAVKLSRLENSGSSIREAGTAFDDMERSARLAAKAIEDVNKATADSYELLGKVINGPVGAAQDKFVEQQGDIQSELSDLQAELADLQRQNGTVVTSQEAVTLSEEDTVLAMAKAESAADNLARAQAKLAENTDPDKQLALEAALIRATRAQEKAGAALGGTAAGSYVVDYTEQINGLEGEIGELEGSLVSLATQHRETMQGIIFGMMEARLATDGWTAGEIELLWSVAEGWGMIDDETLAAITSVNNTMTDYENGLLSVSGVMNEVTKAVDVGTGAVDASGESMTTASGLADHYNERLLAIQPTVETEILQPQMVESQEAVAALDDAYVRVRPTVSTRIEQPNMPQARQQVQNYIGELDNIPTSITTWLTIRRIGDVGGISALPEPIAEMTPSGRAAGTPYVAQTGLAYLHQGEAVLPRSEARNYRDGSGGGGTVVIAPIILDRGEYTDASGGLMFEQIAEMIQAQGAF